MSSEEIKLIIKQTLDEAIPEIVKACREKDELMQLQCPAYQTFKNDTDRRAYYDLRQKFALHVDFHIRREKFLKYVLGLPYLAMTIMIVKDFFISGK